MSKIVAIDSGHSANTGGKRTAPFTKNVDIDKDGIIDVKKGEQFREHYANTSVCYYLNQSLLRNGFNTVKSAWDDKEGRDDIAEVSLGARQAIIRNSKADISISVHFNAHGNGKTFTTAEGIETLIHSNKSKAKDSLKLAQCVHKYLIQGTNQKDRKVKSMELAMCNALAMNTKASILVELAFMTNQREAEELMANENYYIESAEEICHGVCDYFGQSYIPRETIQVNANNSKGYHSIIGKSECTAEQMANYLVKLNPSAKSFALEYARIFLEEGEVEGVRGDGAWAQSCKETGNFAFTGGTAVTFDQNNFCGMGVTKKGMKGNSFATPRLGARAQIQHLKGYATSAPLVNECIDPRYKYISPKGKAPTFEELAGKWAVPGYSTVLASSLEDAMNKRIGYGFDIMNRIEEIKKMPKTLSYNNATSATPSNNNSSSNKVTLDSTVKGTLKVIYTGKDGVEVHDTPEWGASSCNKKYGPVGPATKKGSVFTVIGKTSNGMYKLKSGLYITASTKYVQFTKK